MREWKLSDAWSFSPWTPPTMTPNIPGVVTPSAPQGPRAPRKKRIVPRVDDLYDVQNDLLKAIHAMRALESKCDPTDADFRKAQKNIENGYRIMVRYLRDNDSGNNTSF